MDTVFSRVVNTLGSKAFDKVGSLNVGVAGCGVIGQLLAGSISRFGVEELRLLDNDLVKPENLPNGFLFSTNHVGLTKDRATLEVVKKLSLARLKARPYHFDVTKHQRFNELLTFARGLDVLYGCFDNVPARLCLNSAAIIEDVKYVDIGIQGFDGRVRLIDRSRACYACDPLTNDEDLVYIYQLSEEADCDYAPTLTVLPICLATVSHAILEGLKFIGIISEEPRYDYLYFDFLTPSNPVKMKITKKEDCTVCGKGGVVSWYQQ